MQQGDKNEELTYDAHRFEHRLLFMSVEDDEVDVDHERDEGADDGHNQGEYVHLIINYDCLCSILEC